MQSAPNLKGLLKSQFRQVEECGEGDSFVVRDFLSSSKADEVLESVDEGVQWLDRADPRMQFKLYGKVLQLPQDKAVYGDVKFDEEKNERVEPYYKYAKDTPPVESWHDSTLEVLSEFIAKKSGQVCNHVVINQYRSGDDHISFHHDKSKSFEPGSSVLTLSLGAERILRLRKKIRNEKGKMVLKGDIVDIKLNHGSIFVLGSKTNTLWKHAIIKTKKVQSRRVSLTYRAIAGRRRTPIM